MVERDQDVVVEDLRILDDPVEVVHRGAPDIVGEQVIQPFVGRPGPRRLLEATLHLVAVVDDVRRVDPGEVLDAQQLGQPAKRLHRQREPAVGGRIDPQGAPA